jgi:hypothetical protein
MKAAFSDALKRAAVHVGIGRYLYHLTPQWVDYDSQRKQFKSRPKLPTWAVPQNVNGAVRAEPKPDIKAHAFPEDGAELERRLANYDQDLAEEGLFPAGELWAYILETVSKAGPKPGATYGTDPRTWPARAIELAIKETKTFEAKARADASRQQQTLNHTIGEEV